LSASIFFRLEEQIVLTRLLQPRSEPVYGLVRIVAGLMFSFHGMQKILGVLSTFQPPAGSQLWFGGLIELSCGLLIAFGLFTRVAAFLASGTMAVAYTQFHWKLAFGANFFPGVNKGELALLYSVLFLLVACKGGGLFSLDSVREKRGAGRSAAEPAPVPVRD
jgi:putative oxidoreductase